MDGKDTGRFLTSTISSFIQDRLLDRDRRLSHKEHCAERLAADTQNTAATAASSPSTVNYSDQAVLANLDWGIDALEDSIATSNQEAKHARLDHAERMLQVCAMLDPRHSTAGVPNSYLSAWAHLNLAYLHRLRGGGDGGDASVLHAIHMFAVDPFFTRIDFAPELWESLFLPHMSAVVGWYSEARHRIVMDTIPDPSDLSMTVDFDDDLFNESLVLSVRPDQAEKLRELERAYAESLDENTRLFARYYREVVEAAAAGGNNDCRRKLPPIAEPPSSPLHEVSRKIPDFVKFGPILPKTAGFAAPAGRERNEANAADWVSGAGANSRSSRSTTTATSALDSKDSKQQISKEALLEENKDKNVTEGSGSKVLETVAHTMAGFNNMISQKVSGINSTTLRNKNRSSSSSSSSSSIDGYSPVDSPKTPPKVQRPKPVATFKQETEQMLRLLSNRFTSPLFVAEDSPETYSKVSSPNTMKNSEQLLRYISSHSAPLLDSPRLRGSSSVDSHNKKEARKSCRSSFFSTYSQTNVNLNDHISPSSFYTEGEDQVSRNSGSLPLSENLMPRTRPPKDFVCPITGQLFNDPVTLETGQTFERRAIEEWLKRGNTTCPITRQLLSSTSLPQTNYVLKRLITSWAEQNAELAQEFSYAYTPNASLSPISCGEYPLDSTTSAGLDSQLPQTRTYSVKSETLSKRFTRSPASSSPTSVISQAASETVLNELKPHTLCLCTSEDLQECEAAILAIARIWKESKTDPNIHLYLSKETIFNGFIEVLSASVDIEVLKTSIYVLTELVIADESMGELLATTDSDFDCLTALLINGLADAVVLIYLLRPTLSQLSRDDLVPSLVQVILSSGKKMDDFQLVMEPKDAAIAILEQILSGGDENSRSVNASSVVSGNVLPYLIKCLNQMEGRLSIVSILLSCMRSDKRCRKFIAKRAELLPVLELFHAGDDSTRSICIDFISELVCLNRRTFCNQVLQMIKDEGAFSTMHSFLVYLQMAPIEQQPAVASLLLQLDLLVEPRKMSIYREEAIDAIIDALRRKDFPVFQAIALETLSSLSGRLSPLGDPMTEAWLLTIAGIDHLYNAVAKEEGSQVGDYVPDETMEEEERVIGKWEKRVAFVLCNHDNGAIFKVLEDCLRSKSVELAKSCLVTATWLVHMLSSLPETGMRMIASRCLLDQFVEVLQSSRNIDEKVLAALALRSFISDPDSLKELGTYAKHIYKPLRKLKRHSSVIADVMTAIMNLPSVDAIAFWSCTELFEIDSTPNGEVLSLVYSKGRLFSSHSDGTIKIWDAGRRGLRLVQEAREHSKAVTCLHIPSSGNKLYSGSHDKTIRVWEIGPEDILSVQVHDMKETVQCLTTNADLVCYASQGTGVKVYNGCGTPKHVNFSKNVKCLAMEGDLYCACTGYSIQEVDLSKCTSNTFYSGTRKLLGKQTIHALQIQDDILYAGGSSVDGTAGKAFTLSTGAAVGSFTTGIDIHCIALGSDFVFTGTSRGVIEVWLKESLARVGSIKVGSGGSTRVTTLASDSDGEMLFAGSADGKIQVWALD